MAETLLQVRFLEDNARGAYIISRPMSVVTAYCMTRDTIRNAEKFELTDTNGIYFLYGNGQIYTGKTEQGITRIKQHAYKKDWWTRAIMFLAPSQHFTSNIISELERYSIDYLQNNSPYIVTNGQGSGFAGASSFEQGIVKRLFDEIKFDLEFLGIRMTKDEMVVHKDTENNSLRAKNTITYEQIRDSRGINWTAKNHSLTAKMSIGLNSIGEYVYIIEKGSEAVQKDVLSNKSLNKLKKTMIQDGRLRKGVSADNQECYILQEDIAVESPSSAYAFLYGGFPNGWNVWKSRAREPLETLRAEINSKTLL